MKQIFPSTGNNSYIQFFSVIHGLRVYKIHQADLAFHGKLFDIIQKDRTSVSQLQLSGLIGSFVSEQFCFNPFFWDRTAPHGDEGAVFAFAFIMDCLGQQFFADSAFPQD